MNRRLFYRTMLSILLVTCCTPAYAQQGMDSIAFRAPVVPLKLDPVPDTLGNETPEEPYDPDAKDPDTDTDGLDHSNDAPRPDIPNVVSNFSVGSTVGFLSVSSSGAAEYSMPIACPNGGSLMPHVCLAYNSQSAGYGLAGYGFTITGISAITRGRKTLYSNNGSVQGITYAANDALFLDGKRMILLSGDACQDGATYCLEGDPYTKITAHGAYCANTATTWFEVTTADGMTYQYGRTDDSAVRFTDSNGKQRIASWHVCRSEDVYGNYISYCYTVSGLTAYPTTITYGTNSRCSRGITNRISFTYKQADGALSVFNLRGQRGCIDRYITEIAATSDNAIYRRYLLAYNSSSDGSTRRMVRLQSVQEMNGNGESLPPTSFSWQYLPSGLPTATREDGKFKHYFAFTDNLGSILSVIDDEGGKVFEASYDAWGRQTVTLNTIGLHRGYTGHEMLPELDIINMNGRVYDPVLARFLSPDNYVQMPENTQSFNRYSYCLNNPLKYTDPSGELFGIDDAVVAFAVFGAAHSMMNAAYNGNNVWKAGAMSLLSSAASYGIGQAFGSVGSIGHELLRAGAHGVTSGVISALDGGNFLMSFVSGAASSGIGSYAQSVDMSSGLMIASTTAMGGVAAWVAGGDFLQGAMQGLNIGLFNHAMHCSNDNIRYYHNTNGEICGELPEVVIVPAKHTSNSVVEVVASISTVLECAGTSLRKNSGNSTLGSNRSFYWHVSGERGFYGNQHVRTLKLTQIGKEISKVVRPIGMVMDGCNLYNGFVTDVQNYNNYGYTDGYYTVRTTADIAGGWAGAALGVTMGVKTGAAIGICFGGVGAIPGSIIGGAIGGIIGSTGGSWIGHQSIDIIYGM